MKIKPIITNMSPSLKTMKTKKDLLPFNSVIQKCPECGKLDVYLDDEHDCDAEAQAQREESFEHYD
jgi:hypothetical protein